MSEKIKGQVREIAYQKYCKAYGGGWTGFQDDKSDRNHIFEVTFEATWQKALAEVEKMLKGLGNKEIWDNIGSPTRVNDVLDKAVEEVQKLKRGEGFSDLERVDEAENLGNNNTNDKRGQRDD